jgi:hypothetical protein
MVMSVRKDGSHNRNFIAKNAAYGVSSGVNLGGNLFYDHAASAVDHVYGGLQISLLSAGESLPRPSKKYGLPALQLDFQRKFTLLKMQNLGLKMTRE